MYRSFKTKEIGINIILAISDMAEKSKIKFIKILDTILLWRVYATTRKSPQHFSL